MINHKAKHGLGATSRTAKAAMVNAVFIAGLLFGVARSGPRRSTAYACSIYLDDTRPLGVFGAERCGSLTGGLNRAWPCAMGTNVWRPLFSVFPSLLQRVEVFVFDLAPDDVTGMFII